MNYEGYKNMRNATWNILLDCGVDRLPVDLNEICRFLEVELHSYGGAARFIERNGLEDLAQRTDGFTFFSGGKPVILYQRNCLPQRIRFTVAHELGHLVLGHVKPHPQILIVQREAKPSTPFETQANQFASRLLAPACVLWGLDAHTPEEIAAACGISHQAAQVRARRMEELYRRGKFLADPLERRLYQQFLPYIRETLDNPGGP